MLYSNLKYNFGTYLIIMDSATKQFTERLLASLANNDIICAFLMLWTLRILCKLKINSLKFYFDICLFNSLI